MKRILLSLAMIVLVGSVTVGATKAYWADTETSNGNTFTAGTLDLTVDGNNGTNTVKFNYTSLRPGNQPNSGYILANIGSVNGFLNISNISVTNSENGCFEPESSAGDITCDNPGAGQGELQSVVNLRLFVDRNGDGYISVGDTVLYNGLLGSVPANLTFNEPVNAGANTRIGAILDWWNTPDDNKAQGDTAVLNMTFGLSQISI